MRDGGAIGILLGAQVLLHPALCANQYCAIDVAVNVRDGGSAASEGGRRKTHFFTIRRAHTIGGIRPHIIGVAVFQSDYTAGEAACTATVGGVKVANGGIL